MDETNKDLILNETNEIKKKKKKSKKKKTSQNNNNENTSEINTENNEKQTIDQSSNDNLSSSSSLPLSPPSPSSSPLISVSSNSNTTITASSATTITTNSVVKNHESDVEDDDDVPSEMIDVQWKNPNLVVDSVIEVTPIIVDTITTPTISTKLDLKSGIETKTEIEMINDNVISQVLDSTTNEFFEVPFTSNQSEHIDSNLFNPSSILATVSTITSSPDSSPLQNLSISMVTSPPDSNLKIEAKNDENNQVPVVLQYVSAWGQLELTSSDEEEDRNSKSLDQSSELDQINVSINDENRNEEAKINNTLNISLVDWTQTVLKGKLKHLLIKIFSFYCFRNSNIY